jgi:AraC-like DNA-binding protein
MCLAGSYEIASGGRTAEVRPAHIAVLDGARPPTITFAASCELLWVKVPRVFLPVHLLDEKHFVIDGTRGAGCLVQHTLRGIIDRREEPDLGATDTIVEGVMKLVTAAVSPLRRDSADMGSAHRALALRRVKLHVEQNLGDDALSLQSIADALGMSPRYMNKLFESERTSVMRWAWSQRLERARLALESGARHSITAVACSFGFKNTSHFSRSFRARFGCSPSSLL